MHTIENDLLRVQIDPVGAELANVFKKSTQQEYMWQGDPNIWGSQAPVLFPIIGGLKEGTYFFNDTAYQLPKHGFIRYNQGLKVNQQSATKVAFSLESNAETLAMYPFRFYFEVAFELIENQIQVSHVVKNEDTQSLYFSLGGHPAFNCPLKEDENYEEYYITLADGKEQQSHLLSNTGLIQKDSITVFEEGKIQLTDTLFAHDALIFKGIHAKEATLHHQTKGAILKMNFEDFPDLGIWAKPKAPFVCIEPWLGHADVVDTTQKLEEKAGIQTLDQGKTNTSTYSIRIF